jgi:RNA polymerase sigma-70 factor (ECF subfamily)
MEDIMSTTNASATVRCWVELYSNEMYTWAFYKTGNKETAEDLVQETFLSAFQSYHKFEGRSEPKTWLFAILNNIVAGHFRKKFRTDEQENIYSASSPVEAFSMKTENG